MRPIFDCERWRAELGKRMRLARKQRDLTQQDVANQVGLKRATYANMETGRQAVACDVLWRLAIVVGIPVERLMPEPTHVEGT